MSARHVFLIDQQHSINRIRLWDMIDEIPSTQIHSQLGIGRSLLVNSKRNNHFQANDTKVYSNMVFIYLHVAIQVYSNISLLLSNLVKYRIWKGLYVVWVCLFGNVLVIISVRLLVFNLIKSFLRILLFIIIMTRLITR